jgi:hypothetical protein
VERGWVVRTTRAWARARARVSTSPMCWRQRWSCHSTCLHLSMAWHRVSSGVLGFSYGTLTRTLVITVFLHLSLSLSLYTLEHNLA